VRVVNKLPQFIAGVERRAAFAINQALVKGAGEASVLTPIHSSNLLNSQFKHVRKEAGRIVGTVGYTADYALPVHDPSHPQNFRRATAEKSFLIKGFEKAKPEIDDLIAKTLKR